MTRLEHLLKYISDKDYVCDVGCEGAVLGVLLAKKNKKSIASDIKIDRALKNVKKHKLENLIDVREGNGLETIKASDNVNTIVMAGIGSHLIIKMLNTTKLKFNKIITISNSKHNILRKEMDRFGYKILCEEIIKDKKMYYNIIVFTLGKEKLTNKEILVGKCHQNMELFKEYYTLQIKRLNKLLAVSSRQKEIKKEIKIISEFL